MSLSASERPAALAPAADAAGAGRALGARSARIALGLLALAALLIQGGLFIHKTWLWTGDTIYHRALMAEILNGELLPGGPYAGLPAFYSPLFHYLAAGLAALFRFDPLDGVKVLSVLAAPCTPVVAYYVARVFGFDRAIALLGAFFSTFGGGLRQAEDRVWVDALFTGQHNFFPLFPRDGAFLLLPLTMAWIYRGVVQGWAPGAWLAGLAVGLMILVHTQTAVFVAPVVALYCLVLLAWRRDLFGRTIRVGVIVGGVALAISSFWWIWELVSIVRSGSFGVHMPAYRVPVKLQLAEFPLEFGVFLPLGLLGLALTARRLLVARDPAALLLLVWWAAPTLLAIFRPTDFPGGDTFFPRRLWQFASQPLALVAAAGLFAALRVRRLPLGATAAALGVVGLLAGVPGSWGTWKRVSEFWNSTSFADVVWELSGNFAYGTWLADRARQEGPRTVLVPTPDATMVWYYAGDKVVYLYPTAAIKLAFDVRKLTGFGTDEREADLIGAFGGDPARLVALARKYDAAYIVLRRQDDRLGLVDLPAQALRGGRREPKPVETNHYEYLALGEGDGVRFEFAAPKAGQATVTLRARRRSNVPRVGARLFVNGVEYPVNEAETPRDQYAEITRTVDLRAGTNEVRFVTAGAFELARFVAYTVPVETFAADFSIAYQDPYTVVLTTR